MGWQTIFQDAEHDLNAAEVIAVPAAVVGVATAVWDCIAHARVFDLQSFGLGLAAIVAALGAAQRLRGDADRVKKEGP